MATTGMKQCGFAFDVHGFLFAQQGCNWFEGNTEIDVLSVRNASLYAPTSVGSRGNASVLIGHKDIVLFRTSLRDSCKSHSVFKSFGGIDAEHGMVPPILWDNPSRRRQ